MSIELTPDERADLGRRIDCPVPWCEGRWLDHGGDGRPPEAWLHEEDIGIELGHQAVLSRSRVGAGAVEWLFAIEHVSIMSGREPHEIALALRSIASCIDAQAMP